MTRLRCQLSIGRGFTLTELAVVLVIVALVVGTMLVPLSEQVDAGNRRDTRIAMAEIREALLGFAVVNGRLPCPALATTATTAAGAGLEVPTTPSVCTNAAGVLPWRTLGLEETDAWGRRYTYRVTQAFGRAIGTSPACGGFTTPANAGFLLCSTGDLTVNSTGGVTIASNLPAVVVSHGKNGNGAYTPQGTQLAVGADPDEATNQLTAGGTSTANPLFVKRGSGPTYDDEVVWLPPAVLFNRMITAGKLP
ncbi:prepilin-type N-terminal cleavage/methylation domain-containing protein [Accumulibacter sp.]|uniref:prepilin-type N-terminal cleavage/methylation domain-containing protein n=1 Tax=Accumulibacter sp. TaxID=2053492 RepID=UPI0028C46AFF|nr:prepilin-type N-terminal cleavage/methylation domain-containing protein [Accumulibacter sp.]